MEESIGTNLMEWHYIIINKGLYVTLGTYDVIFILEGFRAAPFKIKVNEKKFRFKNSHRAVVESDVEALRLANGILSLKNR